MEETSLYAIMGYSGDFQCSFLKMKSKQKHSEPSIHLTQTNTQPHDMNERLFLYNWLWHTSSSQATHPCGLNGVTMWDQLIWHGWTINNILQTLPLKLLIVTLMYLKVFFIWKNWETMSIYYLLSLTLYCSYSMCLHRVKCSNQRCCNIILNGNVCLVHYHRHILPLLIIPVEFKINSCGFELLACNKLSRHWVWLRFSWWWGYWHWNIWQKSGKFFFFASCVS